MAIFHYARISTTSQEISNQALQVSQAGYTVDSYYEDVGVSGTLPAMQREGFKEMMSKLQNGDTVITVEISRIGRSTSDTLEIVAKFTEMGVKLRILNLDGIDITSPMGKLILTVMAACATFERDLLVERTKSGLRRAVDEGKQLGSPLKHEPSKFATMLQLLNSGEKITNVAYRFGISERQLYRLKKEYSGENGLTTYTNKYNMQQLQRGSNYD